MTIRMIVLGLVLLPLTTQQPGRSDAAAPADSLTRARVVHLLNRVAYGPRPGEVERVLGMGIPQYLERQLYPERISDSALERTLDEFEILEMSTKEIAQLFRAVRQERQQMARTRAARDGNDADERRAPVTETMRRFRRLIGEFRQLSVTRAVLSERQLYEIMVDFWTNHFNVYIGKGIEPVLLPAHVATAIRPNALGRFEDLLVATAQSPAMLFYLDNVQSVTPGAEPPGLQRLREMRANPRARRGPRRAAMRARADSILSTLEDRLPAGLNENYARELLELHTLGVDGGYTQQDVVGVARILTGWSMNRRDRYRFVFNDWAHDYGAKDVMGVRYPAGRGIEEGRALLRYLASHPSTRRHVSVKLCARFVADEPPSGCVDAAIAAWDETDGDIRQVLAAIFESPDFWEHRGSKLKSPLEFVVSATRALDVMPGDEPSLAMMLQRLAQPPYGHEAPTGYPETQESWVSSGALLERFNVAMAMASGRIPGITVDLAKLVPTTEPHALVDAVDRLILQGGATAATRDVLLEQASETALGADARALVVGLALGSPEFQRH